MTTPPDRLAAALADRYRIERELGAGGMATVYLAEDLKHNRKVAIKVLKPELAAVLGADRFVQEIATTAALQHPNILPLFDSGSADGFLYYVMPFVEGETLRARLDRETQLGVDEAVKITTEVADALGYAHEHGVVHRDIKPENILIHAGRPMVADFGIALAVSAAAGGRMTETGLSLGTPHYMSPEQATAEKNITARSDIYSLGAVLYEMLAGEPPHLGGSAQQIIMKIVTDRARPVTEIRKSVPPNVAAALAQALEKLPADRFASARAFAEALTNPAFTTTSAVAAGSTPGISRRSGTTRYVTAAAFIGLGAVAAWGWLRPRPAAPAGPTVEFSLQAPDTTLSLSGFALASDGSWLVAQFGNATTSALYRRRLDDRAWQVIPGTDGGTEPFLSHDGAWVGFYTPSDHTIRRIDLASGSVRPVGTVAGTLYGASSGPGGSVIYAAAAAGNWPRLFRVSADGGHPEHLTPGDSQVAVVPSYAPAAGGVFYTTMTGTGAPMVSFVSLRTGKVTRLVPGMSPQLDAHNRLAYVRADGRAFVQLFDPRTDTLVGSPHLLADNIAISFGLVAHFSLSSNDGLVYQEPAGLGQFLVLLNRSGRVLSQLNVPGGGQGLEFPRFSPDGRRVAYVQNQGVQRGTLWIYSIPQGTSQRLTLDGMVSDPAWSPDGRTIGYSFIATNGAKAVLMERAADGGGAPRRVLADTMDLWQMAFGVRPGDIVFRAGNDLYRATVGHDTMPVPLTNTRAFEQHPALSPDGRWLAYASDVTGQDEVYVRSYPEMGPPVTVSIGGGESPDWSHRGDELYYQGRTGLVAATIAVRGGTPTITGRTTLFPTDQYARVANRNYDVSPDGRSFVMVRAEYTHAIWRVNAIPDSLP